MSETHNQVKRWLMPVAAFAAGLAIGLALKGGSASEAPATGEEKPKTQIADVGKLRERRVITETVVVTNVVNDDRREGRFPHPRGNPREMLEKLREQNPAEYARMTNNFARFRARRMARAASRREFLENIDTARMSKAAQKTHGELQAALDRRQEIEQELMQEDLDEATRRSLMQELHELRKETRKLNRDERSNLLQEMTANLGLSGDDAAAACETIEAIVEATQEDGRQGPPGPPPDGASAPQGAAPPGDAM